MKYTLDGAGQPPRGSYSDDQLELVLRQISLWETNRDDVGAFNDWLPDGVLVAPRGVRVAVPDIASAIAGWHELFMDLRIEVSSLFASIDGCWLAIEWTWNMTRRSDGAQDSTPDSIIVELREGKIVEWREYFDTFGSVEFSESPSATLD